MFDGSSMSFNNLHNKQNINCNNRKYEKLTTKTSEFERIITQTDSDTDNDRSSFNQLSCFIKKSYLKTMISQILRQRRENDKIESQKQIYLQKKMYTTFTKWKKLSKQNKRIAAESQLLKETKQFRLLRQSFLRWAELIKDKQINKTKELRMYFDNFKMGCSISLSLRLKRIEVQSCLLKRRMSEIIFYLRNQSFNSKKIKRKAEIHWRRYRLKLAFEGLQLFVSRQQHDKLRYQKYQLAYLFRRKILLKNGMKSFQENRNEDLRQ